MVFVPDAADTIRTRTGLIQAVMWNIRRGKPARTPDLMQSLKLILIFLFTILLKSILDTIFEGYDNYISMTTIIELQLPGRQDGRPEDG